MKKIFYAVTLLFALVLSASAQTLRVGAEYGYTTSPDPSPDAVQDGGKFFPGATASFETPMSKRFTLKIAGDFARPQLPTLFTTDEGDHKPTYEFRAHPQFQVNFGRFFAAVGADAFYQGGFENDPGEEYSRSFGINPTVSIGASITKNHEISATYLFRDKGTDLYGVRANYFYTLPGGFRAGVEANQLRFKERNREGYVDSYYENDNVFKVSFEVPLFRGGYKH